MKRVILCVLLCGCVGSTVNAEMYTPPGMQAMSDTAGDEVRGQGYRVSGFLSVRYGKLRYSESYGIVGRRGAAKTTRFVMAAPGVKPQGGLFLFVQSRSVAR